jgi:hypothetical protein
MQPEPAQMNRERAYPPVPTPLPARTFLLDPAWPFPDPDRRALPEIRRAARCACCARPRDWGLAARR